MKKPTLLVFWWTIAAAISTLRVGALDCYVCSSTNSNAECNQNTKSCQAPLNTCMTTVDTSGDFKAIVKLCASTKTCASAASGAAVDANGNGNSVTCCSTRLCNFNGVTAIRVDAVLLVLPLLWTVLTLRSFLA